MFLGLQRLMQAFRIAAARHHAAGELVDDDDFAIVDDGGHMLWLQRLDGAAPVSAWIGPQKAITSAIGLRESGVYEKMINEGRVSFLSVTPVTPLEGGVPIIVDGQFVGAVGVSGVKSSEDVQIAKAGIAALGL